MTKKQLEKQHNLIQKAFKGEISNRKLAIALGVSITGLASRILNVERKIYADSVREET